MIIAIDLSSILSIIAIIIAISTTIYAIGYKLGSLNTKIDDIKSSIDRLNAQFSADWFKEYGKLTAQVERLSKLNYDEIIKDLKSKINSSLKEILESVFKSLTTETTIKNLEIHQETFSKDPTKLEFQEVIEISDLVPLSTIYLLGVFQINKYEISFVGKFYVHEDKTVESTWHDINEIHIEDTNIIPEIQNEKEAIKYSTNLAEQFKGYFGSVMPFLASIMTFLLKEKPIEK